MTPIVEHTRRVMIPEDGDIASLTDTIQISNGGNPVERKEEIIWWSVDAARKGDFRTS